MNIIACMTLLGKLFLHTGVFELVIYADYVKKYTENPEIHGVESIQDPFSLFKNKSVFCAK